VCGREAKERTILKTDRMRIVIFHFLCRLMNEEEKERMRVVEKNNNMPLIVII